VAARDLNDPERFQVLHVDIHVAWEGARYVVHTEASQDFGDRKMVELSTFNVQDRVTGKWVWLCHAGRHDSQRTIRDYRSGNEEFFQAAAHHHRTQARQMSRCRGSATTASSSPAPESSRSKQDLTGGNEARRPLQAGDILALAKTFASASERLSRENIA